MKRRAQKKQTYKVAAIGMFDGVHRGHQAMVRLLTDYAVAHDMSSMVVTFDRHPLEVVKPERAPKLISTVPQKFIALRCLGVDEVLVLEFDDALRQLTAEQFMRMLYEKYDVRALILGFNHRFGSDRLQSFDDYKAAADRVGMKVVLSDKEVQKGEGHVSSSRIRQCISDGKIAEATDMLGNGFVIVGNVGRGLGNVHKIGFPTANVEPYIHNQLIPKGGVYAAVAIIDGEDGPYPAMVNVGTRPTVTGGDVEPNIEAHLIGYDGDIYGHEIELTFYKRLRDERKFDSLEELGKQLAADKEQVMKILTE